MAEDPGSGAHEHLPPGLAEAAEEIRRGSRKHRLRRGLTLSVLTVALATLAAEGLLRVTNHREDFFEASVNRTNRRWVALSTARLFEEIDDPVRRYAMRPGASVAIDGWSFHVSSHGSRGSDFPAPKPPDERRLVCLGDSFAFGLWCGDDETLVGQLARLANAREEANGTGIRWRGINLGVPGYHSGQQLRALEEIGLALDPDAVVLYFNTNDIEQEGFFYDADLGVLRRDFLPLPTWLRRPLWNSHLYGWIVLQHKRLVEGRPAPHMDPDVPYAHVRTDNQAATREAISRMAALCAERNVPLFFVNQPHMTWMGDTRRPDWNVLPLVAWAEELRVELDLPGVDLTGWVKGYRDGVDRPGAPPDYILDVYFADERAQEAYRYALGRARALGREWNELSFEEMTQCFADYPEEIPREIDFHLTGAGYEHMARVVYPRMQSAGLVP